MTQSICKHCNRLIIGGSGSWVHDSGLYKGKHRCATEDSGLKYGYEAEPLDMPCTISCLGSLDVAVRLRDVVSGWDEDAEKV